MKTWIITLDSNLLQQQVDALFAQHQIKRRALLYYRDRFFTNYPVTGSDNLDQQLRNTPGVKEVRKVS